MASFTIAYNTYVKPVEGGYANVVGDKGKETYAGISRVMHPTWKGWPFIDSKKVGGKVIKRNTKFPELDSAVVEFYKKWWDSRLFGMINSQDVANLLYDYNINSDSLAVKAVQRIVGVTADGAMGPQTVAAINSKPPAQVFNALKEERRQLYERLAKQPDQAQFYVGWMNRLNSFQDMVVPGVSLLVIIGIGVAAWYFISSGEGQSKKQLAISRSK